MRLHECFRNQILIMKLKERIERFYYLFWNYILKIIIMMVGMIL